MNSVTFCLAFHDPVSFNFLPKDNILVIAKLKAFADDKFDVAKMMISVFDREEKIVKKAENAGYQHFLLFSQCFQRPSF